MQMKITNIHNDMIYQFDQALLDWECSDIIHGIDQKWRESTVARNINKPSVRQGLVKFAKSNQVPYGARIVAAMKQVADIMKIDVGDPVNDVEMQLSKYEPGSFYTPHTDDEIHFAEVEGRPRVRKLSASLQLSDPNDYEGGKLRLKSNAVISHNQGALIVFPSFVEHEVQKLIKGTRYSLVVWYRGPRWR